MPRTICSGGVGAEHGRQLQDWKDLGIMGKMMEVYLAARYSRIGELNSYKAELEGKGLTVTSRWLTGEYRLQEAKAAEEGSPDIGFIVAQHDVEDISTADTIICFTETPRSNHSRGGRHVEFGMALALKKRIVIIGPLENVFYCLPEVERYNDWADFRMASWGGLIEATNSGGDDDN